MACRFTNTEKWADTWFSDLKPLPKLLFIYLCDRCDIAGFLEWNVKTAAFEIGTDKQAIEKALREIESRILYSSDRKFIFVRNFLKNQKNYPLNPKNSCYKTILAKLEEQKQLFGFESIECFFNPPLTPPLGEYGNSDSKGISKEDRDKGVIGEKEEETTRWRKDLNVYLSELWEAFNQLTNDREFIAERERYHPQLDIILSLEKACKDYWATEAGWKNKKSAKTKTIDWRATFKNALTLKSNQVYKNNYGQSDSTISAITI